MRGLVLEQTLRLQPNRPMPATIPGEATIQVCKAGICSTDLHIVKGYMNYTGVLGHEFVGVVDKAPSQPSLIGKRVVGEINAACRTCPTCRSGSPTHCPDRTTLGIMGRDGAFADYLSLPLENLHVLPDSISDEQAVFIEPLAAACEIPDQIPIHPTDRIIIIGDGKLGLLCTQVLALLGAEVSLLGHHCQNHTWLESYGVQLLSDSIQALPGADIIVEATGSPEGLATASRLVRPRGKIILKSTYHGQVSVNMTELVIQEISVIGSRCGPFAPALRLLQTEKIQIEPLIHARFPLEKGIQAMEEAARSGTLKVLLDIT